MLVCLFLIAVEKEFKCAFAATFSTKSLSPMKLIDLSFREEAFEREFGVEKRNWGEKILRGYICIVLIELLMIGISMASEPSYAS